MTEENFIFWLSGFLTFRKELNKEEVQSIKDNLMEIKKKVNIFSDINSAKPQIYSPQIYSCPTSPNNDIDLNTIYNNSYHSASC